MAAARQLEYNVTARGPRSDEYGRRGKALFSDLQPSLYWDRSRRNCTMKTTLTFLLLSALFCSSTAVAQTPVESARPSSPQETAAKSSDDSSTVDEQLITLKLMSANLRDSTGSPVGRIENVLVDPASGKIELLAVSLLFPTNSTKILPIPWKAVKHRPEQSGMGMIQGGNQIFTSKFPRSKLEQAPTFERYRWANLSDETWKAKLRKFYSTEEDEAAGASGSTSERSSGTGNSPRVPAYNNDFIGPRQK